MPDKGTVYLTDDKLGQLAKKAGSVVFEAKSTFPFELFPDKISITLNRVSITYAKLFYKDERPLPFESINGAHVFRNLFFASLHIETFGLEKPEPIRYLKVKDARLARRFILALIECRRNNIDFSGYSLGEIKKKLLTIGKVREAAA